MIVQRMPVHRVPGFDCIYDNATCPGCKHDEGRGRHRIVGNHGISGGSATYAVRTELPDGRRFAVALEVHLRDFPASIPESHWSPGSDDIRTRIIAGPLSQHVSTSAALESHAATDCTWIQGLCDGSVIGYTHGSRFYDTYGNPSGAEQTEDFWLALEDECRKWAARVEVVL